MLRLLVLLIAVASWHMCECGIGKKRVVDVEDKNVLVAGKCAAESMNNSTFLKCTQAELKWVSGAEYFMTIKKCRPKEDSYQTCSVKVYYQPWSHTCSLKRFNCSGNEPLRNLPCSLNVCEQCGRS